MTKFSLLLGINYECGLKVVCPPITQPRSAEKILKRVVCQICVIIEIFGRKIVPSFHNEYSIRLYRSSTSGNKNEASEVDPIDHKTMINVFHSSLQARALYHDMILNPPQTYEEELRRASDYANENPVGIEKKEKKVESIMFTDEDLSLVPNRGFEALVVTINIMGFDVERVMVDMGTSINVLYLDIFNKLKLETAMLMTPIRIFLYGFIGDTIQLKGMARLIFQKKNQF
nr:uncharacterized protein LOC109156267 [Ipomoea batatas]